MSKVLFVVFLSLIHFLLINWKHSDSNYCRLSNKIVNEYSKELTRQKGLYLIGAGGAFMDDIKEISLHYQSLDKLSVNEARRLYIEISEGYLKRYNENVAIRPYLHNYPFTINNLKLMIGFIDETRQRQGDGFVALMFIARNKLWFEGYDLTKSKFYDLHCETYAEAVEIVRNEQGCLSS